MSKYNCNCEPYRSEMCDECAGGELVDRGVDIVVDGKDKIGGYNPEKFTKEQCDCVPNAPEVCEKCAAKIDTLKFIGGKSSPDVESRESIAQKFMNIDKFGKPFEDKGWICPKCDKVLGPSMVECIYCNY